MRGVLYLLHLFDTKNGLLTQRSQLILFPYGKSWYSISTPLFWFCDRISVFRMTIEPGLKRPGKTDHGSVKVRVYVPSASFCC